MKSLDRPEPPVNLDGESRIVWDELCIRLKDRDGQVHDYLLPLLELYCVNYGRWRTACDTVKEHGEFIIGRHGHMVRHPAAYTITTTSEAMTRQLTQLGLTVPSNKKLLANASKAKRLGKFDKFMIPRSN